MEIIPLAKIKEILNSEVIIFKNFKFDEHLRGVIDTPQLDIRSLVKDPSVPVELSFVDCVFDIPVRFVNIELSCSAQLFKDCIFNKEVYFGTTIISDFMLENVVFNDDCIYNSVTYLESVNILNTTFNKKFIMDSSKSKNPKINQAFFDCTFNGSVSIKNVIFEIVDFSTSSIGNECFLINGCIFGKLALFRKLNLRSNTIFLNTDITNCSFLNSEFESAMFSSVNIDIDNFVDFKLLIDEKGQIYEELKTKGMYNASDIISDVTIRSLVTELKSFEKNFDNKKQFELAGEFHKMSMDVDRVQNSKEFKFVILSLYKLLSEYGEDYFKALKWFLIFIILFSLIYLFSGLLYIDGNNEKVIFYLDKSNIFCFLNDYALSFLYSVVNSFPVKRDLDFLKAANGFTVFYSSIQTVIQSILIALIVIALKRKFKR